MLENRAPVKPKQWQKINSKCEHISEETMLNFMHSQAFDYIL